MTRSSNYIDNYKENIKGIFKKFKIKKLFLIRKRFNQFFQQKQLQYI